MAGEPRGARGYGTGSHENPPESHREDAHPRLHTEASGRQHAAVAGVQGLEMNNYSCPPAAPLAADEICNLVDDQARARRPESSATTAPPPAPLLSVLSTHPRVHQRSRPIPSQNLKCATADADILEIAQDSARQWRGIVLGVASTMLLLEAVLFVLIMVLRHSRHGHTTRASRPPVCRARSFVHALRSRLFSQAGAAAGLRLHRDDHDRCVAPLRPHARCDAHSASDAPRVTSSQGAWWGRGCSSSTA